MQSYDIELHGSGLQIYDSGGFDVPDDYNVSFPATETYLCIPTIPDHIGGVKLDLYRNKPREMAGLELRYSGEINCKSGILVLETSLVGEVCRVSFDQPSKKHIEVWTDKESSPTHVAISLTE